MEKQRPLKASRLPFYFFNIYQNEDKRCGFFFFSPDKYQTHSTFKLPENKNNVSANFAIASFCTVFFQLPIKWTARKGMKPWEVGHCQAWNTTCSKENWTRLVPNTGRRRGMLDRSWMGLVLTAPHSWSLVKARQIWKHTGYCQPAWFNDGKISFLTQAGGGRAASQTRR